MAMTDAERSRKYRQAHPGINYKHNKEWRYKHPETRYAGKRRYYSKTAFAPNGKKRLSLEEINLILAHEIPDMELSKILGRSVGAIQKARCIYRKRTESEEYVKNNSSDNQ